MIVPRKRCGKPGDLLALRRILWRAIVDTKALTDYEKTPELVLKTAHALAQLGASYRALVEASDVNQRLTAVEDALARHEAHRARSPNGASRIET